MAETIPAEAAPGAAAKESKGKHKAPKMELSGAQKAAAVIVALGAEKASLLYKYMEPDDVEQITLEVARLGYLDSKATEDVLTEFYQMCMTNKAVTEGGLEYARTVLEKAYGEQAAEDLLNKVTKSLKNREFAFMNKADVKSLYSALQNERPQTIALVLSYVDADKAAGVIAQLEEHKQIQVVEGIAKIESVSPTAIKIVEAEMSKKFSSIVTSTNVKVGGMAYGGVTPANAAFVSSYYGMRHYAVNLSVVVTNLLFASFGSTIAGALYDATGSYLSTDAMILVLAVLSAAVSFGIDLCDRRMLKRR